jgi:histidine ammonia-lyase
MSTSSLNHTAATTDRRVITLAGPRDLSREAVEAVAWGGARLALAPAALERAAAGQAELAALLAGGARVYGVNTGMGWLASVDLDPAAQAGHQRNLLLGRAVGGPPWLEPAEARALLVARLGNLLSGHAGVGPELCRFLVDRVNDGFVPAVPRRGAGSAGEVVPLAHAFQTLVGVGLVLGPDGHVQDAAKALADRGALPHRLQAKEGIALLAGSPLATALALARLRAGERLAGQRLHRLLDGRFSGLPDQLSPDPGPVTGLVAVHKRAAGALHEARRLAAPASVGQADTALGQEDAASFALEAAEQLRRVEQLTREVVACELLAARQAWWLRGTRADGLGALADRLEELVAPVERDRPLGPDLDRLVEALGGDRLPLP